MPGRLTGPMEITVEGVKIQVRETHTGSLLTYLGEFRDREELARYVRAREDANGPAGLNPAEAEAMPSVWDEEQSPHGPVRPGIKD